MTLTGFQDRCLMMGFDGTEVTPQIKQLIEVHYLGTILLTAKNLKSAEQFTRPVLDIQTIAHNAGHPVPLAIALDQENGGVNSLFDESCYQQFPSQMGIAATGSTELAYKVAKATAEELRAVGINWIMGPCLDVLTNDKNQPLGVRSTGDDPEEVSNYGAAYLRGFRDAGIASCGKHFPS
jgi:beta-N-acetylhexosaminidase